MCETRICACCGAELPIGMFRKGRFGSRLKTCNKCMGQKIKEGRVKNRAELKAIAETPAGQVYDEFFANMTPQQVLSVMARAKKWLESRGYVITLRGEYREVKVTPIKF